MAGRRHPVPRRHRVAAAGRARRQSLTKGSRVIGTGRLRQRSYEAQDGGKRTVYEVQADDIAPSLRTATAQVTKTSRANGAGQDAAAAAAGDPWSSDHGDGPVLARTRQAGTPSPRLPVRPGRRQR